MGLIYLTNENYTLKNNRHLKEILEFNKIDESKYESTLLPFIQKISGHFYKYQGPDLKTKFLLPQLKFTFNKLSLLGLEDFLETSNQEELQIPIQDRQSLILENNKYFAPPGSLSECTSSAMAVLSYKKQIGNLKIQKKSKGKFKSSVTLEKITDHSDWIRIVSKESINKRLDSILQG